MRETKIQVKNRTIKKCECCTFTGKFNVDKFVFEFDDEWEGLNKTLVLHVGEKTYNVPILNDEAILPMEVYCATSITFGVFGTAENVILASKLEKIYINKCAYEIGENPDNLPTPTQWDIYIEEINKLLNECKATENACEELLSDLEKLRNQTILEMESIKEETTQELIKAQNIVNEFNENVDSKTVAFNQNAEEKENNLNAIAEDVRDMASALTFATFDVEPTTGELFVNNAESLGNMGFSVENDGALYVEIPKKEVN